MPSLARARRRGVTLIELMVALAVVAILSAVAYPQYTSHTVRAKRSAAGGCLLQQAQFLERVYASNMRYDQDNGAATALPATACRNELAGVYTFAFAASQPGQRSFVVEATPQGTQAARDTACATLSIDQANVRGRSGSAQVSECWR